MASKFFAKWNIAALTWETINTQITGPYAETPALTSLVVDSNGNVYVGGRLLISAPIQTLIESQCGIPWIQPGRL